MLLSVVFDDFVGSLLQPKANVISHISRSCQDAIASLLLFR